MTSNLHSLLTRSLTGLVAAVCLLASCSGPSTRESASDFVGEPSRVRYMDFRSGQVLELVNEAHSDRVELYSEERTSAATKVTTDEVMDELVKLLRKEGFDEVAAEGRMSFAGDGYTSSLEVEVDGRAHHLTMHAGSTPEQRSVYRTCLNAFMPLYNSVYGLQTVSNEDGTDFFESGTPKR